MSIPFDALRCLIFHHLPDPKNHLRPVRTRRKKFQGIKDGCPLFLSCLLKVIVEADRNARYKENRDSKEHGDRLTNDGVNLQLGIPRFTRNSGAFEEQVDQLRVVFQNFVTKLLAWRRGGKEKALYCPRCALLRHGVITRCVSRSFFWWVLQFVELGMGEVERMEMYPKFPETQEALPCCAGIEHLR